MFHFFQARLRERDAFPQQDCHFSGVATLDAFPGNFYLTADGGLRSANDALDALVTRTPVNEGGVVFETAEPFGGSLVDRVTGAWSETLAVPTTPFGLDAYALKVTSMEATDSTCCSHEKVAVVPVQAPNLSHRYRKARKKVLRWIC